MRKICKIGINLWYLCLNISNKYLVNFSEM